MSKSQEVKELKSNEVKDEKIEKLKSNEIKNESDFKDQLLKIRLKNDRFEGLGKFMNILCSNL